ncbi:MAG: site-2 protease family protein [Lachnospiraceae bacterium]|nr:site-2 protease family protein [Lachnospiraceae bacterium]
MSIPSILYTLVILCIVIIVHEFGHMIVAKSNGIYVKEFWVGFGPTLISFTKNETRYCLKPIPFGGACVFEEDPECEDPDRLFNRSSVWARIMTVFAGPFFNIILAFVFSVLIISMSGSSVIMTTELVEITKGSPADEAGLKAGDIIKSYNGRKVDLSAEVVIYNIVCDGSPVELTYERDGQEYTADIRPEFDEKYGRYMFGIVFGRSLDKWTSMNILKYSFYYVRMNIRSTVQGLKGLILGRLGVDSLSGPVGMAGMVSDIYNEARQDGLPAIVLNMFNLALIFSASLGIMNLLPLPALDGGKLVLLVLEAIRHKPVSRDKEALVNFVGFALLMILMVFVMYNDILKIVRK